MLSLQEQNIQNKLVSYGWFWKVHLLKWKVFSFNYIWLLIGAVFHLFQGNLKEVFARVEVQNELCNWVIMC